MRCFLSTSFIHWSARVRRRTLGCGEIFKTSFARGEIQYISACHSSSFANRLKRSRAPDGASISKSSLPQMKEDAIYPGLSEGLAEDAERFHQVAIQRKKALRSRRCKQISIFPTDFLPDKGS